MPGSGNQSGEQPGRSLGGQIKNELLSALRLLFKEVGQASVDTRLSTDWVSYVTDIPCESVSVPLETPDIQISEDPIRALSDMRPDVQNSALLDKEAPLAPASSCRFEPVACFEPVLEEIGLSTAGITFENVSITKPKAWPIDKVTAHASAMSTPGMTKPGVNSIQAQSFKPRSFSLLEKMSRVPVRNNPRYYALPIKKTPIPPHRFSNAAKEKFRAALAEKAKTVPANVQLRIIFERMNMALYAAIQQDDHGNLLCVPKNEFLGKNAQSQATQAMLKRQLIDGTGAAYLVYGLRLDTREDIRALVPTVDIDTLRGA